MQYIKKWKLKSDDLLLDVVTPNDITNDLYKNGIIDDPYWGLNHNKCYDLCRKDYTYTTKFDLEEIFNEKQEDLFIKFLGVDLFSDIFLNGQYLGSTENMFKEYSFNISNIIKEKENTLEVKLKSTINYMDTLNTEGYYGVFNTPRLLIRKEQCCFGWDWAANIPGYGIWRDVIICKEAKETISDVKYVAGMDKKVSFVIDLNYVYRSHYDPQGNFIEVINPYKDEIKVYLSKSSGNCEEYDIKTIKVDSQRHIVNFIKSDAKLWWPSGYGEQPLYNYKVELLRDDVVISTVKGKLAFRSVGLKQEVISEDRISYQITVNNIDIYVKGSNWVPIDCFTGVIDDSKYTDLLNKAKDANYNMLRVWGGGIYEKDIFYDTCDKLGIMVWQDFMFACSDIPDDNENWLNNTIEECVYQVKRLRNHPSIVYWCGGNEKTGTFGSKITRGDYFTDIILRGIVNNYDGTRPFSRQSPFGWAMANDVRTGESHHSSMEDIFINGVDKFRDIVSSCICSFNSENATMGPMSKQGYERIFPIEKYWPLNEYWNDRLLRNPYGVVKATFAEIQKKFAEDAYGKVKSIDDFIKKGMLFHSELVKAETEYQRFNKGLSWGFMNWMYSDMWPTASWSVIDYYTEPKQAYYQQAKSYRPVLMSFVQNEKGKVVLFGVNDTLNNQKVNFEYGLKNLNGDIIWSNKLSTVIDVRNVYKKEIETEIYCNDCYLFVNYEFSGKKEKSLFSLNIWRTCKFESDYSVKVNKVNTNKVEVKIYAKKFAKSVFVFLNDNYKYKYSENYVDIEANEEKTIYITSNDEIDLNDIRVIDYAK